MSSKVHIPEVVVEEEILPPDLVALRGFARLMDEAVAIPGTNRRFGLDAALGLIPGVGDIIGALLSTWVVIGALRHRVPTLKVVRMIVNIIIDATLGSVPVVGDIFDFFYEENVMNLGLLLAHRDRTRPPRSLRSILGITIAVVVIILAAVLLVGVAVAALVFWLIAHRNAL